MLLMYVGTNSPGVLMLERASFTPLAPAPKRHRVNGLKEERACSHSHGSVVCQNTSLDDITLSNPPLYAK
jgi:hypothetical protein